MNKLERTLDLIENAIMLCEIQIKSWQDAVKYEGEGLYNIHYLAELIETEQRKLRALEAAKMYLKQNK